jgi:predicted nucleic acid-binding protein
VIDANILIYSVDSSSRYHAGARDWLTARLNGESRVAIP